MGRRMEGTPRGERIHYRCAARSIVPGSPILDMYLPEAAVSDAINAWIRSVFRPGSAALTDPLNRAQERVVAARLERDRAPSHRSLGRAEVEAMLDHLAMRVVH